MKPANIDDLRWHSVRDEPPTLHLRCTGKDYWAGLGLHYCGAVGAVSYTKGKGWRWSDFDFVEDDDGSDLGENHGIMITHWMPMPEAHNKNKKGE